MMKFVVKSVLVLTPLFDCRLGINDRNKPRNYLEKHAAGSPTASRSTTSTTTSSGQGCLSLGPPCRRWAELVCQLALHTQDLRSSREVKPAIDGLRPKDVALNHSKQGNKVDDCWPEASGRANNPQRGSIVSFATENERVLLNALRVPPSGFGVGGLCSGTGPGLR